MSSNTHSAPVHSYRRVSLLQGLQDYLNQMEINNPKIAEIICKLVPSSCPFARTIRLFGKTLLVIPPLCHFNSLYGELMMLRLRALNFLSQS